jgi:hypothetical protein
MNSQAKSWSLPPIGAALMMSPCSPMIRDYVDASKTTAKRQRSAGATSTFRLHKHLV